VTLQANIDWKSGIGVFKWVGQFRQKFEVVGDIHRRGLAFRDVAVSLDD